MTPRSDIPAVFSHSPLAKDFVHTQCTCAQRKGVISLKGYVRLYSRPFRACHVYLYRDMRVRDLSLIILIRFSYIHATSTYVYSAYNMCTRTLKDEIESQARKCILYTGGDVAENHA